MKIKETLKEIFIIVLLLLNIISIAYIPQNLIVALQSPKAIKINSLNRNIISQKILEEYDLKNYKLKGTIEKVEYRQLIGDWSLYIYYKDAEKETLMFNDDKGHSIREYINENGYDKGKISFTMLLGTIILLAFSIFYAIKENRKEKLLQKLNIQGKDKICSKEEEEINAK